MNWVLQKLKPYLLIISIFFAFQNISISTENKLRTSEQFQKLYKSIVEIKSFIPENARTANSLGTERRGTGVAIDNKHILTIGYIVIEAEKIDISLPNGKTVPGKLVGYDHQTGFALLKTLVPAELTALKIGNSDLIKDKELLFIMPYPTHGRGSAGNAVSRRPSTFFWEYHLEKPIYVYPMNESWAGTPLINDNSEVLGIGSLYIPDSVSPGIMSPGNMFVPINILKPIMQDLIKNGRRTKNIHPYLGLSADDINGNLGISRVSKNGPAEKSGLQAGDIILTVNGKTVKTMESFYKTAWTAGGPGSIVNIKIKRDQKNMDFKVKSIDRNDFFVKNKGF